MNLDDSDGLMKPVLVAEAKRSRQVPSGDTDSYRQLPNYLTMSVVRFKTPKMHGLYHSRRSMQPGRQT